MLFLIKDVLYLLISTNPLKIIRLQVLYKLNSNIIRIENPASARITAVLLRDLYLAASTSTPFLLLANSHKIANSNTSLAYKNSIIL